MDLWAEGLTATAIGKRLDMSMDAIRSHVRVARRQKDARAVTHKPGTRPWPDEKSAKLKQLWAEGKSGSEIAKVLGKETTRNAVIGKVHRLRIPPREKPQRLSPPKRKRPVRAGRACPPSPHQVRRRAPKLLARREAAVQRLPEVIMPPECKPVSIMDHQPSQCGWVIGDPAGPATLMCSDHKVAGKYWCAFHNQIGYSVRQSA